MVGNYARHLGFEPELLVRHYAQFLPRPRVAPAANHPANPEPLSSAKVIKFGGLQPLSRLSIARLPGGAGGIVASCLGAILLFAAASWTIQSSRNPPASEQMAQGGDDMPTASTGSETADVKVSESALPDDQPATLLPGGQTAVGVKPLSEEDAASAGLNGLTALIEQTIGEGKPNGQSADKPLGQIAAADEGVQTAQGRVFGSANEASRLVLRAKAPVWVRIEDAQGNV